MNTALLGLAFIIAGWIIQLAYTWKGDRHAQSGFLILYVVGVAILAVDGYRSGQTALASLNLVSLLLAGLVLAMIESRGGRRR